MLGLAAWRRSRVIAVDVVAVAWAACMLVLAGMTADQVDRLGGISDSMDATATAESGLAGALSPLGSIPFLNLDIGGVQHQLRAAAASTSTEGGAVRAAVRSLSRIAALVVVLLALFPLLVVYLPLRLARAVSIHSLRRDFRLHGRSPAFAGYLAHRALVGSSFDDLQRITRDPAADVVAGRHGALAEAEMRRIGALPPPRKESRRGPTPA